MKSEEQIVLDEMRHVIDKAINPSAEMSELDIGRVLDDYEASRYFMSDACSGGRYVR